ncbi:hypothetical protein [uncultured Cohaesibacter sp.]|uniref:hypothetical protein n=1 Tax=uncultured Cohaesibacter sp. TaxID=1002546 RepID=UPI0029300408|nr:hypothetical protein [uncultured Cohaesibacter sp.]
MSFSRISKLVALTALGLALSGCVTDPNGPKFGGTKLYSSAVDTKKAETFDPTTNIDTGATIVDDTTQLFLSNAKKLNGYCPSVSILGDTNLYQSYVKGGENNPNKLIYQANITQTARECTELGAETYIKVGVGGRVLGGPKSVDMNKAVLPLRIVVKQDEDVLYSKLHKIPVQLTPPSRSGLFAQVDESIAIPTPQQRNVQILVGFDPGPEK